MQLRRVALIPTAFAFSACGMIFHGPTQKVRITTVPPGAHLTVAGKPAGTSPATVHVPRQRSRIVILEAEAPGYERGCTLLLGELNGAMTAFDSIPAAIPLIVDMPSGRLVQYPEAATIELQPVGQTATPFPIPTERDAQSAWEEKQRDLCDRRFVRFDEVIVTTGDISQPYEILGNVRVDTTDESNFGPAFKDAMTRGIIVSQISPSQKETEPGILEALQVRAVQLFGDRVDAVINASIHDSDRDLFASGLAVRFTKTAPAALPRDVATRLSELDRLREAGSITAAEYDERRKAILSDL